TSSKRDWSSDVCSSDLRVAAPLFALALGYFDEPAIDQYSRGEVLDRCPHRFEQRDLVAVLSAADARVDEVEQIGDPLLREDARRSEERRVGKECRARVG